MDLAVPDMTTAVTRLRSPTGDPVAEIVARKQLLMHALQSTIAELGGELRVIECFSKIREDWRSLPCRNKLRHVLGHGVSFSPGELAALLGHKVNTVRSTLMRMRTRGEVKRERHGKWTATTLRNGDGR
jgi:hypothetical protein